MKLGLGLGITSRNIGLGIAGAPAFSSEATALFARFSTPPSGSRKTHINTLINSLKTAGVWSKLDCLWIMAAADAQAAKLNWKADQYNLTEVNAPSFTADQGFLSNGTTSYLKTGFVPDPYVAQPEILSNGDFADGTGWTTGGGWSIGSGVATVASSGSLLHAITVTAGKTYRINYDITAYTSGIITPSFSGGVTQNGAAANGVGSKTTTITAVTGNINLGFVASGSPSMSIDNVSVKEVPAVTPQYSLNSAHVSTWARNNVQGDNYALGMTGGSGILGLIPRRSGVADAVMAPINTSTTTSTTAGTVATSVGMTLASRSTASLTTVYKNGSSLGTHTVASAALPAQEIYLLCRNNVGSAIGFDSRQYAMTSIGANLTGTEVTNFYNAINTYMVAIGA